ncbi:MAG: substrate-binding domain-containing protein [Methylocystaceae bacterium]|nr:substrate-binding domain-containing protein [Methylocystaceae bacterium]
MSQKSYKSIWILLFYILFYSAPALAAERYIIGFSQATTTEPWRLLFNQLTRHEANKHENLTLLVRNAQDSVTKQIADIEELISRKVDALLVSPKEAEGLTEIINRASKSGIPVFVLDRDILNKNYTQFIGGDNTLIGRNAGTFAIDYLGGKGKAKGVILEIWGGQNSTPAHDRHNGFRDIVDQESGISCLNVKNDGDWKQDKAYQIATRAFQTHKNIDLVYAHNDPMAYGAFLAARDLGIEKKMAFIGIDGIPAEGVRWVYDGILDATFLYKTPGGDAIQQALRHLQGEKINKKLTLPTLKIDKNNAEQILRQHGLLN